MGVHDGDAGEVIEGEIVVFGHGGKREGRRGHAYGSLDEDTLREIIDKRVQGVALQALADEYGVSKTTVSRWCGENRSSRRQGEGRVDVVALRAEAAEQIDVARRAAWKMFREHLHPRVKLDALTRVESLTMAKAKLMGLNMPIKIDVQVHELSAAEQELQEMINEAKAKAAADEAAVIEAASKDPDL